MRNSRTDEVESIPEGSSRRRFLLVDVMALVVASAVMLSARRVFNWSMTSNPFYLENEAALSRIAARMALLGFSFVWLAFMMLRPSDRRRLRAGAPGLLVHLAVVTSFLWRFLESVLYNEYYRQNFATNLNSWKAILMYLFTTSITPSASLAVAILWVTLLVVGRWNPDRGWDDRLGRLLGCLWLVLETGEFLMRRYLGV